MSIVEEHFCVPAERVASSLLEEQARAVKGASEVVGVLDMLPGPLLILNGSRQVVFANRSALDLLGWDEAEAVGMRPGELASCSHAKDEAGGCGTSEACRTCGAARALSVCEAKARGAAAECQIHRQTTGEALDLRVTATPLSLGGYQLTMLSLTDISHEKRRRVLERLYFHDLLNIVGALSGCVQLIPTVDAPAREHFSEMAQRLTGEITEAIAAQRDLLAAETNDLGARHGRARTTELLARLAETYRHHGVAEGRKVTIAESAADVTFTTEAVLLTRVLGNLLKNALEAVHAGETVTVNCQIRAEEVVFSVHNAGVVPAKVALQIFQRSFSTKGEGRGLGTYAARLFTERYLGGRLWFTSTAAEGTTFWVALPRD